VQLIEIERYARAINENLTDTQRAIMEIGRGVRTINENWTQRG
jgi:hypothetical protein